MFVKRAGLRSSGKLTHLCTGHIQQASCMRACRLKSDLMRGHWPKSEPAQDWLQPCVVLRAVHLHTGGREGDSCPRYAWCWLVKGAGGLQSPHLHLQHLLGWWSSSLTLQLRPLLRLPNDIFLSQVFGNWTKPENLSQVVHATVFIQW